MTSIHNLLSRLRIKPGIVYTFLVCLMHSTAGHTQEIFRGLVRDSHTGEFLPFASIKSLHEDRGKTADSLGFFEWANWEPRDSIRVSVAGYEDQRLALFSTADSFHVIELDHRSFPDEVVVTASVNTGLFLWKKIRERIDQFDPYKRENISFEQYNKLEIDLNNLDLHKLRKNIFLKPFSFIINPLTKATDSAGFVPAYLLETRSLVAYQHDPEKRSEVVEAVNNRGFLEESVASLAAALNVRLNIFQYYLRIFQRDIPGPFHANAPQFYRFAVADTQRYDDHFIFHLSFYPKNKTLDLFSGDAWIESGSYKILRLSLFLGNQSGLNFLKRFSLFQEFKMQADSSLTVVREKFYADLESFGNKSISLSAKKTSIYSAFQLNSDSIKNMFTLQSTAEKTATVPDALRLTDSSWQRIRPDSLTEKEKLIYQTIDNLNNNPEYESLKDKFKFAGSGYLNIGNFELGRWFSVFSGNQWEGFRTRVDLGTNKKFSKDLHLHVYLAYGTRDKKFKGLGEVFWISDREEHWTQWHGRYISDVDNGIDQPTNLNSDNVFALAIRKPGSLRKFLFEKQLSFSIQRDILKNLRLETSAAWTDIQPLQNLPLKNDYSVNTMEGRPLRNFEWAVKIRFAAQEKMIEGDFFRYAVSNPYPVVQIVMGLGWPGVGGSDYRYWRAGVDINGKISLRRVGNLRYTLFAEKYQGKLPFAFLGNLNGNDGYWFSQRANNLLYRYEFLADQNVGFRIEQNFGKGIFRLTAFTRKLKWTQFWNLRTTWASLSEENRKYNAVGNYFKSPGGKPYAEIGTGIENIFRVIRIDLIWRILPNPLPAERVSRFGVFGSFRFRF